MQRQKSFYLFSNQNVMAGSSRDRQGHSASHYPMLLTFLIGGFYFISAGVTAGILSYFVYYLRLDNMAVPVQLILPLISACLSLAFLLYSLFIHAFRVASAHVNLTINILLFALWTASLGLIGWKLNTMVLSRSCSIDMWVNETGMMVCKIYKAMAAFLILSWISSICSFILDWTASSTQRGQGVYAQMRDDRSAKQRGTYMEMKENNGPGADEITPAIGPDNTPKL